METVMTMLLMRFALMALMVVVLALGAFAVIVVLRRRGRSDRARAGIEELLRLASTHVESRRARQTGDARNSGGALVDALLQRRGGPRDRR